MNSKTSLTCKHAEVFPFMIRKGFCDKNKQTVCFTFHRFDCLLCLWKWPHWAYPTGHFPKASYFRLSSWTLRLEYSLSCHERIKLVLSTSPVQQASLLVSLTESLSLQHLLTTRTTNRLLVKRMVSGLSSALGAKFFHKETDKGCPLARMHEEVFLQCLETR